MDELVPSAALRTAFCKYEKHNTLLLANGSIALLFRDASRNNQPKAKHAVLSVAEGTSHKVVNPGKTGAKRNNEIKTID